MEKYQVWLEGYACTGQRASAEYLGEFEGTSFEDACLKASLAKFGPKETANFYDANRNTFWVVISIIMKTMQEKLLDKNT